MEEMKGMFEDISQTCKRYSSVFYSTIISLKFIGKKKEITLYFSIYLEGNVS